MTVARAPGPNPVVAEDVERILAAPLDWQRFHRGTVLVSGAAGLLPAYLVETFLGLRARGIEVRVIGLVRSLEKARARFAHAPPDALELIRHDVREPLPPGLPRADWVVHAASQASPRFYGVDPVGTLEANTLGTAHLLAHARRSGSRGFLFFSSGEVYGRPLDPAAALGEHDFGRLDPTDVRACYAESKRLGETMCVAWHAQHGVPARIVRPFHTYGPGMRLDDGRVFADFVADIVARRDIVLKSDGLAMRPFCYLADATRAFLTVLLDGQDATAYNVGNPAAEISIGELAALLVGLHPALGLSVVRGAPAADPKAYLQSPVARSTPDIARIAALGWAPETSVAEGFRRTLRSFDPRLA